MAMRNSLGPQHYQDMGSQELPDRAVARHPCSPARSPGQRLARDAFANASMNALCLPGNGLFKGRARPLCGD